MSGRTPGAKREGEAHYRELRRRAVERSRQRRKKTGEPAPGQEWLCGRCDVLIARGKECPRCGPAA